VMEMAPGSVDVASPTISTAVNIGISAGVLGGGLLLASNGARSTVLVAGVLSTAALALALGEKNGSSGDRLPEDGAPADRQRLGVRHERAPGS
jgi:predicted MFS family arabinose efflux permease